MNTLIENILYGLVRIIVATFDVFFTIGMIIERNSQKKETKMQTFPSCDGCPCAGNCDLNAYTDECKQKKNRLYKNHTLQEITQSLKDGQLPIKEDLYILVKYLERLEALQNFAYATQEARQHLPNNF